MQGLSGQREPDEKPIGRQRPPALDELPYRIVCPVQRKTVDDQIVGSLPQWLDVFILNDTGVVQDVLRPDTGKRCHKSGAFEDFFNQKQPILNLISGGLLQDKIRPLGALTIAGEGYCVGHSRRFRHGREDRFGMGFVQTALAAIYPPLCIGCGTAVDVELGLCGPCWRDTPFIGGVVCQSCGIGLPGTSDDDELCDDCMQRPRPWAKGRAIFEYDGIGRRLVLGLKHGDRHEIATSAATWMMNAAQDILEPNMLVAPIPLHWMRLLKRKSNQSALLANVLAKKAGLSYSPDLLIRPKATRSLDGLNKAQRFEMLSGSIAVHPKRRSQIAGRPLLLVDDVMTSGATFEAATHACHAAGAQSVSVLALARVTKPA